MIERNQDDCFQLIFDYINYNQKNIANILRDAVDIKDCLIKQDNKSNSTKDFITKYSKNILPILNSSTKEVQSEISTTLAKENGEKETKKDSTYISTAINSFGSMIKGVVTPLNQINTFKHNTITQGIENNISPSLNSKQKEINEKINNLQSIIEKYSTYITQEDMIKLHNDLTFLKEQLV